MMPTQKHDPARSLATQSYRTTKAAQRIARQLRPLADVLSPRTRATLAAIKAEKGGRNA